jgi:phage shock protein C
MRHVSSRAILFLGAVIPTATQREDIMNSIHDLFRTHGLVRVRDGRVLGGVVAGLGRRIGLDPWPARLLFLLALLLIPGSQILVYPILWILMPLERPDEFPAAVNHRSGAPQPA